MIDGEFFFHNSDKLKPESARRRRDKVMDNMVIINFKFNFAFAVYEHVFRLAN